MTCSVMHTRFPQNGNRCGKPARFLADGQGVPVYLCKYHNTRCHQGHKLIFSGKDNEPMTYDPTQGWINPYTRVRISHPAHFLPHDCWKVILSYVHNDDHYLMKFTCKTWAQIIGTKCVRPDLLHVFSDYRFYCLVDYLGVENIGNIDKFSLQRKQCLDYLLDKGCPYTDKLFIDSVSAGTVDNVISLFTRGYIPPINLQLFTIVRDMADFLISNGIPVQYLGN